MDRKLLINAGQIYTFLRYGIPPDYGRLFTILLCSITENHENAVFFQQCIKNSCAPPWLADGNEPETDLSAYVYEMEIFIQSLHAVIKALNDNQVDQAMDILDAFHFLPDLIVQGRILKKGEFTRSYLHPLEVRWGLVFDRYESY